MWSLAGNQAVDQPIQQLCSPPAAFAWDACACSRGIQPLWVCAALKLLCAPKAQPADQAAWDWEAGEQAADSASLGLGCSQAALCLENAHPASAALGELAAGRARGPVLGGQSSRPGLKSLRRAGPPWD